MKIIVGGIIEKDNKILMVKEAKKKCEFFVNFSTQLLTLLKIRI